MTPRPLLVILACAVVTVGVRAADPPAATPHADLDRAAVEVLKELHNRGADLYNAADAAGATRLYDTALRAVGPFLTHRPKVQAAIADGLAEAAKLDGAKAQAYRLHELIDQVRNDLKAGLQADAEAKPGERKADPKPGDPKTETKGGEPIPEPNPGELKGDPKPGDAKSAPKSEPPAEGSLSGTLLLDGKPVAYAAVLLVPAAQPKAKPFLAATGRDGKFAFPTALPAAAYAAAVAGGVRPIPAKYRAAETSGLEVVVKAGSQAVDLKLQSK
jgi:hypothetical protein